MAVDFEWLDANEWHPEDEQIVLAIYKKAHRSGESKFNYHRRVIVLVRYSGGNWRFLHPADKTKLSKRVTHWGYLPDLPPTSEADASGTPQLPTS